MRRSYIVVSALVIAALAIGGVWAFKKSNDKNESQNDSAATANTAANSNPNIDANGQTPEGVTVITYSDSGFSPTSVTVKQGSQVTVRNISSQTVDFESDPHSAHSDNTELNLGTIAPNQNKSFFPKKTGTWGYHNSLDVSKSGTVIVQ